MAKKKVDLTAQDKLLVAFYMLGYIQANIGIRHIPKRELDRAYKRAEEMVKSQTRKDLEKELS